MESLPFPVTRVVIFDIQKNLDLSVKYRDLNGKEWRVFCYSNNDLGFRRDYFEMPADPNFSHIVWIIPPLEGDKEIDVSFIPDILIKADKIIDLNLTAVLDPEARIEEFLFEDVEPAESFKKYLQLVFSKNLKPNDLQVLRGLLLEYELKDKDLVAF